MHTLRHLTIFQLLSHMMLIQRLSKDLESAVALHSLVLKSPKPVVRLNKFGDFGYEFMVRGYVSSAHTLDIFDIASDVRIALVQKLQKQGIKLAVAFVSMPVSDLGKKNEIE